MNNKEDRIFPTDCRCHVLARGEVSVVTDGGITISNPIAVRAVRSIFCPVHPAQRYLPRFLSQGQR
jgi:hypothetical protein